MIRFVLGIVATTFVGWLVLRFILYKEKRPFLEEIAFSYGLGMGLIALEFILFWFIGISPNVFNILLPWLAIFFILFFTKRIPLNMVLKKIDKQSYSLFEKFLLCGIGLEVLLSFSRALLKPLESFDSIAMYAIRAKIFYLAGGIPKDFFSNITAAFPNSGHPLAVSLSEAWVYTFLGSLNEFLVKAIFPLYLVTFLVLFYFALREFFGRRESLLFTFVLATIPQFNKFSTIGYADFMLSFYFTAGFIYLFHWVKKRKAGYLFLSAIAMGLSCWTKMEGWALFLCTAIIFFIFAAMDQKERKSDFAKLALFSVIVLLIGLTWIFLINTMQLENRVFQFGSFGAGRFISSFLNFDRCPLIAYEFQKQFFGPKKWNIIWIVFLVLIVLNIKRIFKGEMKFITFLLFLIMIAYGYSYLLIPIEEGGSINWNIGTTLSRLFIHFTPLGVFWVAYLCCRLQAAGHKPAACSLELGA